LHEVLNDKDKQKLNHMKKKDGMTWGDSMEIMGVRRDTYKRVRGAARRK
jgi:hypothetical protein